MPTDVSQFLSIRVTKPNSDMITLDQSHNIDHVLKQFGMNNAKDLSAPLEVSKSGGMPGENMSNWWLIVSFRCYKTRYSICCKQTQSFYKSDSQVKVFCDADFTNDKVDQKSCSVCVILLPGGAKQGVFAQSTVEVEFVSMAEITKEIA
ncbi:hypothetical protein PR048_012306 [Dryococelus australis]|uniref:Uncharacterized protein n=1 Tax=Dryococelus australis TaxID=614101 RepID=A0ABQ9HP17_9NEOP|nr:hypothetical protein PR048_012306 [Dryococelus australis]